MVQAMEIFMITKKQNKKQNKKKKRRNKTDKKL